MLKISSHSALLPARAASRIQELKRGEEGCFIVGRRERGERAPLRSRRADYGRPRDAREGLMARVRQEAHSRNEIQLWFRFGRDAVFGTATALGSRSAFQLGTVPIIREKVQNCKLKFQFGSSDTVIRKTWFAVYINS